MKFFDFCIKHKQIAVKCPECRQEFTENPENIYKYTCCPNYENECNNDNVLIIPTIKFIEYLHKKVK